MSMHIFEWKRLSKQSTLKVSNMSLYTKKLINIYNYPTKIYVVLLYWSELTLQGNFIGTDYWNTVT